MGFDPDSVWRRMRRANELIMAFSSCGRGFFRHEGAVSRFELVDGEPLLFDKWTEKHVSFDSKRVDLSKKGFSEGGNLFRFALALRDWIVTGETCPVRHLRGTHWGYPAADLSRLSAAASDMGFEPDDDEFKLARRLWASVSPSRPAGSFFRVGGVPGRRTIVMYWEDPFGDRRNTTVTEDFTRIAHHRDGLARLRSLEERAVAPFEVFRYEGEADGTDDPGRDDGWYYQAFGNSGAVGPWSDEAAATEKAEDEFERLVEERKAASTAEDATMAAPPRGP